MAQQNSRIRLGRRPIVRNAVLVADVRIGPDPGPFRTVGRTCERFDHAALLFDWFPAGPLPMLAGYEQKRGLELMTERFGDLPADAVHRIESAPSDQLRAWIKRVLHANTVDDVFG